VEVKLPAFSKYWATYLDSAGFGGLQDAMTKNPESGDAIEVTGGLSKLRHADPHRGKGKRGGLRVSKQLPILVV